MGLVNMLLSLPAGRQMLALPKEQNAPLEAVMRDLREQAGMKANTARARGDESLVEYWRLVATYAKYVARAFKRENLNREKAQLNRNLLSAIPSDPQGSAGRFRGHTWAHGFRFPSTAEENCLLQVTNATFAPFVEAGDYIHVDFSVRMLTVDSLYLVAVDGLDLSIRGFNRTPSGWYVHDNSQERARLARMLEDRVPHDFEIIGLVVDVFKKNAVAGGAE